MRTRAAVVAAVAAGVLGASVTAAVAATPGRGAPPAAAMQDMQELHDQMGAGHAATMAAHMAGSADMPEDCVGMHEQMDDMGMGSGHFHDR